MNFNSTPIYNAHQSQFLQAMQREAKTITNYWTEQKFPVLFKKNQNTNQNNNNITIYYSANEPIKEGDLLCYGGKVFLTLNAETIECEIFRRSDCLETTMVLETYSNKKEMQIPCYSYDLLNVNPNTGSIINLVNGTIELMTQHCVYSDDLTIDSTFSGMGGVYKIVNLYYKSGILHIFVQRALGSSSTIYTIKIASETQYPAASTAQLKTVASRTEGIVENPTINWSSSAPSIASIDNAGLLTCHTVGTVNITATWVEHSITEQVAIEVTDPATTPEVCEITGEEEIIYGTEEIYTAKFYDATGIVDDNITPVWSLELPPTLEGKVQLVTPINKEVTVAIAENEKIINSVFNLKLTDANSEYEEIKPLKICGWFRKMKADTE